MAMATVIQSEFDQKIIDTLECCIIKMSDKLREIFDPEQPESKSLFRLFCFAINTRTKIVKKNLRDLDQANLELAVMENAKSLVDQGLSRLQKNTSGGKNSIGMPKKKNKGGISFWRNKKLA